MCLHYYFSGCYINKISEGLLTQRKKTLTIFSLTILHNIKEVSFYLYLK